MGSHLILSAVGDQEVVNTATETSIFSGTVPGGTLGTDTLITLRMIGDWRCQTGSADYFTLRVKYGGTTLHTFVLATAQRIASTNRADITTVFLGAEGATNAQRSMMEHKQGGPESGAGEVSGGNDHNLSVNRLISVDSTADQTLEVTVQLSAASSNLAYKRQGVWVDHHDSGAGSGTDLILLDTDYLTYNNDAAEHSVASFTIPGGTIGTGNLVIVRVIADVLNNTGSAWDWFANAYLGGSQVFDGSPGVSNLTSANRRTFPIEFWIGGAGATDAQIFAVIGHAQNTADNSGGGNLGTTGWQANQSTNVLALDSTGDLTFELRIVLETASVNLEYRYLGAAVAVLAT